LRDSTIASYFAQTQQRDPYHVVVAELMLQQTQVDRVISKYEEFLHKWPTLQDLAKASLADVYIIWKGLGYNRRARYLHEMAKKIVEELDGIFPSDEASLKKLPGLGAYTARAVRTFAFGKDVGVIDTNVERIFSRVMFGCEFQQVEISSKEFSEVVDCAVPLGKGDPWNQALMDLGAGVCFARTPKCDMCPLQDVCVANQQAKEQKLQHYAALLNTTRKNRANDVKKKPKQKFSESNRYFRGKIVDKLREGPIEMEMLWQYVSSQYNLSDRLRWGELIERLVIDKLIQIHGTQVSLAG